MRVSSLLYQLGRWSFRARRLVLIGWLVVLIASVGAMVALDKGTNDTFSIPGTESQQALDSLNHTFAEASGASANVLIVTPDGTEVRGADVSADITDAVQRLTDLPGVGSVTSPLDPNVKNVINDAGNAAVISVGLDGPVTDELLQSLETERENLLAELPSGSEVFLGGDAYEGSLPGVTITEALGVVIALLVLLVTFGTARAAGIPLVTALMGAGISLTLVMAATAFTSIASTTLLLALMLGIAVGIDYALFVISRHADQVRSGLDPEESAARSVATAGSAVVFAGLTVIIALLGLAVAQIPFLTTMGVAAAGAVALAVVISLTLTPALLGFAGGKIIRKPRLKKAKQADEAPATAELAADQDDPDEAPEAERERTPAETRPSFATRFFTGWISAVTRRPLLTIIAIVIACVAVAAPAVNLRLALPDAGSQPQGSVTRISYDQMSEHFGPGYNGPLIVTGTIIHSKDPVKLMDDIAAEIERMPGVAAVPLATPNPKGDTGIIQVIPEGGPTSEETAQLVRDLRDANEHFQSAYGVDLKVTGFTAVGIDVSDRLGAALLPFGLLVVGLSLVLLTIVFRSIWVPVKATLGYLLSVGASFGVVAMVFEWGWFADLLHVAKVGPIISFMPIILMGVLFGLAMDYQVFLVSRMREDYVHHRDARQAIRTGFLGSARVVTAAAVIMFAVFAAFVPEGDTYIKPIALGLAVGVFVDAFIVRMMLVPAALQLLGDRAWWIPRWLERRLPHFDVEGEGVAREIELADWPENADRYAIAADDLTYTDLDDHPVLQGVDLRVEQGSTHLVHGPDARARATLLAIVAGRLAPTAGRLRTAGYLVPERASAVRRRVAYLPLTGQSQPEELLAAVLAEKPRILALDGIDTIPNEPRFQTLLAQAHERGITIVCSAATPDKAAAVLPPALSYTTTALGAAVQEVLR
ncbi:efflux RND transporter permease subunit [Microbacterium sp. CH-015]|uniref:efflux RND transporter permease subunit n=1 Tax=Microbacterium sp. CH-015 TaxID=3406734 RepID=UPI003C71DA85